KAVEAAVHHLAGRYVIGSTAFEIERLWRDMFRNEFARGGPVVNSAIGAIEMALWDIVGKALDRPVYDLLGGRIHDDLPAYANAWYGAGSSVGDVAKAAKAVAERGYRGLKFDPFECGRDPDPKELRRAYELVAAVRDAVGPDVEVLIDCHGRFSVGTAIAVARALEPCDLYWLEEPTDPENVGALAKIGRSIGTRLATGERCYTRYHLQALLATNEVQVLQPDIIPVGGILEAKKIAAMADACYIPVSYHNPFGPVATAAAIQLDACTSNFVMQESFCEYDVPWRFDLLANCPRPVNGRYAIPTAAGLGGIDLNVDAVREHPYDEGAFLPMWGGPNWRARF
ncbi:MAG TPA: mandelate racemase/muconate lactonizing enzyme family protein, partial [Geminicoccaceae bacterium]|nr:mandelate racemase/muconate lactonizing enzyme family protein [Geminicoccaceae bacterium]